MFEWFERRIKSAYLRKLEDDNARLADEYRQLLNSVLASRGMATIQTDEQREQAANQKPPRPRVSAGAWGRIAASREAESTTKLREEQKLVAAGAIKREPAAS